MSNYSTEWDNRERDRDIFEGLTDATPLEKIYRAIAHIERKSYDAETKKNLLEAARRDIDRIFGA